MKPDLPATLTCRPRPRPWEDPAIVFIDEVVGGGASRGPSGHAPHTPLPHPLRPSSPSLPLSPSIAGHYLPCCLVVQALVTRAQRVSASVSLERRCVKGLNGLGFHPVSLPLPSPSLTSPAHLFCSRLETGSYSLFFMPLFP